MMFLAGNDDFGFGGFVAGIIGIGILMLAVCWIVFPFIVITKFNDLIRDVRARRVEVKTKQNEENAGPPPGRTLNLNGREEARADRLQDRPASGRSLPFPESRGLDFARDG